MLNDVHRGAAQQLVVATLDDAGVACRGGRASAGQTRAAVHGRGLVDQTLKNLIQNKHTPPPPPVAHP